MGPSQLPDLLQGLQYSRGRFAVHQRHDLRLRMTGQGLLDGSGGNSLTPLSLDRDYIGIAALRDLDDSGSEEPRYTHHHGIARLEGVI